VLGAGEVAVSVNFLVQIDTVVLGHFNSCEGLGVEVVYEQREEGGNNTMVWNLPTRLKYSNVRLSRPLTQLSLLTLDYFNSYARETKRQTAVIAAFAPDVPLPIAMWGLNGVLPVKWTGPKLGAMENTVSTETLELAHEGFIDAAQALGRIGRAF
jgi:phage tail-like protein